MRPGRTARGRPRRVERNVAAPAEKAAGVEPAQHQVGVGHGGFVAAAAVAGGTGNGAGAARADAQAAAGIHKGDAAAARADCVDVDDRQTQGQIGDDALGGGRDAAGAERDVGAGSTHVKGDDRWFGRSRRLLGQGESADYAAGRAARVRRARPGPQLGKGRLRRRWTA